VELGHRLKLFRVAADLKQGDLAKRLDVSTNYVYMIESGRREPSRDYLEKFAKSVNIPLSVLFLESSSPKDPKARKLMEKILTLLSEYADVTGVKNDPA